MLTRNNQGQWELKVWDRDIERNPLDESLSHMDQLIKYAKEKDLIRLKALIDKHKENLAWDSGLEGACLGGHRDLAEFMIQKGATDWNYGLYNACSGGHRDLAELMIEKGATKCYNRLCHKSIEEHL